METIRPILEIERLPFTIGTFDRPENPAPFPGYLPMRLAVDSRTGRVLQMPNDVVRRHLDLAYGQGSLLGTAMDDTPLGRRYAEDFLGFLYEVVELPGRSVLEIGAGRGYLLRRLRESGADARGVEPGSANRGFWEKHGVSVVCDRFPSRNIRGKFELIVGFGLLEHIESLPEFFAAVRDQLEAGGQVVFAVPDCVEFIADGDPSMLLHEHWHYFTEASLWATLSCAGLNVTALRPAGFGSVLYVAASAEAASRRIDISGEITRAVAFSEKCRRLRRRVLARLGDLAASGRSLGIYVPGRALALLPPDADVRFFDDDPELEGRYFPPFNAPVENMEQLLSRPVDEVWILSRSFGGAIAKRLRDTSAMQSTKLISVGELLNLAEAGN